MNLNTIQQEAQLPLLGYTAWWRLSGIEIEHTDFAEKMTQAGFTDFMPNKVTHRKALSRALRDWSKEVLSNGDKRKILIRKINESNSKWMVFAIIFETKDLNELGLSHETELRILLLKETGDMVLNESQKGEILPDSEPEKLKESLLPYYQNYQNILTSTDLSNCITNVVDSLKATSLREQGGLYYIPATEQTRLAAFAELVNGLSDKTYFMMLPVPDMKQARKQLANNLHAGLLAEIEAAKAQLNRLDDGKRTVRESTIMRKLEVYKKLKQKAALYTDLLQMKTDQILYGIQGLQVSANALLV
jgi:hypothetical protein